MVYENEEEAAKRLEVLDEIDPIVKGWVKQLTRQRGYTDQMVEEANAVLYTFGSYRLGVMDKASLAGRKKLLRAQTEREILQCLDHPFLPTLYTHFETDKFSCLVMEFCPGGDLHSLRQRQPGKYFSEQAVKIIM